MTEAVKVVTFINLMFVIFLMLSGTLGGWLGETVYYLAFMIPIAIGFYASKALRRKRDEVAGVAEGGDGLLGFDIERGVTLLPLIPVAVTVIFGVSLLTSLFLSVFGASTPTVEDEGIFRMLLTHAVVPALFEEALFRYIPMKLLLPYSKRWCIIYSALCFALIHCSFFQMPYAFVAGAMFMMINISFGSVWPSVILHFINNAVSVIWIKYCGDIDAGWIFVIALAIFAAVSCLFIYRQRKRYTALFDGVFDKGDSFEVTYAPISLMVICCYVAISNLF